MADERNDQRAGNDNIRNSKISEKDGMGGQPIGGNDSSTGSGTSLTQGADFSAESPSSRTKAEKGGTENSRNERFIGSEKTDSKRGSINDEDEPEE